MVQNIDKIPLVECPVLIIHVSIHFSFQLSTFTNTAIVIKQSVANNYKIIYWLTVIFGYEMGSLGLCILGYIKSFLPDCVYGGTRIEVGLKSDVLGNSAFGFLQFSLHLRLSTSLLHPCP